MKQNILRPTQLGDALDVLGGADLLITMLYRHQNGLGGDGFFHVGWVYQPTFVYVQQRHLKPGLAESRCRVQNLEVLDARRYQVPTLLFTQRQGHSLEGHVARFGAAGSEHELLRLSSQSSRQRRPGLIQRFPGFDAKGVAEFRGGHRVLVEEKRLHGFEHALVEPGGGGVVQIHGVTEHSPS
jgi:hypothetical protein